MDDPVSCLLCLDAFERPAMLRIHLRPIAGGDPHEYYFCQRCGGAIAAEYLYVQSSAKAELAGVSPDPDLRPKEATSNVEISSSGVVLDSAALGAPATAPGEVETVNVPSETAASPRRGKKGGPKESF